ncbi:unnamed protein product [Ostreobium quekettii]|uniref:Uncharacterized protein n=1 Tax=Ostreobium quekettii TaxID=121088 RepID=A0A8S1JIG6_9CHLO|nr:unnamed protein product [Ostreobium quekettii]|eukprot:evm.model.scf_284.3 EVM.evm.TU.scf_284.3   scf_284:101821-104577(+)
MAFTCCSCTCAGPRQPFCQKCHRSPPPVLGGSLGIPVFKGCVMVTEEPYVKVVPQALHDVEGSLGIIHGSSGIHIRAVRAEEETAESKQIWPTVNKQQVKVWNAVGRMNAERKPVPGVATDDPVDDHLQSAQIGEGQILMLTVLKDLAARAFQGRYCHA